MILITGATGNVGRHVAAHLKDMKPRRLSRSASGPGAVAGELTDLALMEKALDGVDRVFLLWPLAPPSLAEPLVELLSRRVRRVVFLSTLTVGLGLDDDITRTHAELERMIDASGLERTFIRAGGFATNLLWEADAVRSGTVRKPFGAAGRSLVHEHDLGAVAARALRDDAYAGAELVVTGPEVVTQRRQIELIAEATGRPVRWEELSREAALAQMIGEGWDSAMAENLLNYHGSLVEAPEPVTSTVEEVTGVPALSFRQWARDHADAFR
ncbi:NmrA family NAD(P)-binding protein [Actinocorallia populi]|uniref:NmrA family NAD(P)-binding protein n=1 Tax=Actinocorallia populi TaxID=2079200 RepID=UPI000D088D0D|nr:NmrA family NAD(P)-binding protein [Actinocorallia populi]